MNSPTGEESRSRNPFYSAFLDNVAAGALSSAADSMNPSKNTNPNRGGFTLLEVLVASIVFLIGLMSLSGTMVAISNQRATNRQNSIVSFASRTVLERMHAAEFSTIYALYNDDPSDDPDGVGTAPGGRFAIDGLEPVADTPDGMHGEVIFPTLAVPDDGIQLREDSTDESLGMPRDLDGDSIIDSKDHSTDYVLIPVMIRIRWQTSRGVRQYETHTLFCEVRRVE